MRRLMVRGRRMAYSLKRRHIWSLALYTFDGDELEMVRRQPRSALGPHLGLNTFVALTSEKHW